MEGQREEAISPSHTARKWQSQYSNPDSLALDPMFLNTPYFWLIRTGESYTAECRGTEGHLP